MACDNPNCVNAFPNICSLHGRESWCLPQDTDIVVESINALLNFTMPVVAGVDAATGGSCTSVYLTASGSVTANESAGCAFIGVSAGFDDRIHAACTVTCGTFENSGVAPCTWLSTNASGQFVATTGDDPNAVAISLQTSGDGCSRIMLCKPDLVGGGTTPTDPYTPTIVYDASRTLSDTVAGAGGVWNGMLSHTVADTCIHQVNYGIIFNGVGGSSGELLINGVPYEPRGRSGADGAEGSVNHKSWMIPLTAGQTLSLRFVNRSAAGIDALVTNEHLQVVKMCE